MYKLTQFKKQVNKVVKEEIKQNEKQKMEEMVKKGGINYKETCDQYLAQKFMNFYIYQKIYYLKYALKQGKERNDKDFMNFMSNCLILIYQNEGQVIFNKLTFKQIIEQINDKKLSKKTIMEQNEFIRENIAGIQLRINASIQIKEKVKKIIKLNDINFDMKDFSSVVKQLNLLFN